MKPQSDRGRSVRIWLALDQRSNHSLELIKSMSGVPKTETVRRLIQREMERLQLSSHVRQNVSSSSNKRVKMEEEVLA